MRCRRMRGRRRSLRSGMRRKFPVLHRTCWLTGTQVCLLLRFQRTPRVLLHGRLPLLERNLLRRRRVLAHERRSICGRPWVRQSLIPGRRWWRSIMGDVAAFAGSRWRRDVFMRRRRGMWIGRLRHIPRGWWRTVSFRRCSVWWLGYGSRASIRRMRLGDRLPGVACGRVLDH